MTWLNFMSDFKGSGGNFGKKSWTDAFNTGIWSGNQIKVALQNQGAAGYSLGEKLVAEMNKYQGAGHADNPLGKYQGAKGNLGLASYNAAKGGGWKAQDIYDEIQSGRSGMFMTDKAMNQYLADTKPSDELLGYDFPTINLPDPAPLPGTQTGQANVGAGYNALGIRTPRPAGHDLNTGGTKKAFGRDKKNKDRIAAQLSINPLT